MEGDYFPLLVSLASELPPLELPLLLTPSLRMLYFPMLGWRVLGWEGLELGTYAEDRMLVKVREEVAELKVCMLAGPRLARREMLKIILKRGLL